MKLFRLDSSIRTEGSVSRRLADAVEQQWVAEHPHGTVLRRDLGLEPLPALWPAAVSAGFLPPDAERTPDQVAGAQLAAELVDELQSADAYVFAVPIYNWGVPQHLKAWIDLIHTDPRTRLPEGMGLAGRPAVVVEARGGGYAPGTPREGWDHVTPYLTHIFGDLWGLELSFARAELTLADVNPAMHHLRDLAAQQLVAAEEAAAAHGAQVARRLLASA
jgi:FMN-dependent NADH-azoreductase